MAEESSVKKVYLMLGPACNFHCRHCLQAPGTLPKPNSEVSDKVYKYIERLAALRASKGNRLSVLPWGGEPLMYWDVIKAVVERLGSSVDYGLVSNGKLLSDKMVEYMNAHDIRFTLSNDGANTARVRGCNVLESDEFCGRFMRLDRHAVNAVVHAYNQDYQALIEYVNQRVPGTQIHVEPLECTWDMPPDLYAFDTEKYRASLRRLCATAKESILYGRWSPEFELIRVHVQRIMRQTQARLGNQPPPSSEFAFCRTMRYLVNVDRVGNVYYCHNFGDVIGTVDDGYDELLASYDARRSLPQKCRDCESRSFCRGSCLYNVGQAGSERICEIARIYHEEIVRFVASFSDMSEV